MGDKRAERRQIPNHVMCVCIVSLLVTLRSAIFCFAVKKVCRGEAGAGFSSSVQKIDDAAEISYDILLCGLHWVSILLESSNDVCVISLQLIRPTMTTL